MKPYYYIANHRGDTVECVTDVGSVVAHIQYDAFGNIVTNIGSFSPLYTFSTKEHLPEINAMLYAYRIYLIDCGRWTQRDPIDYQDSVNLYQFCGNNPVNGWDLWGLKVYSKDFIGPLQEGDVRGYTAAEVEKLKSIAVANLTDENIFKDFFIDAYKQHCDGGTFDFGTLDEYSEYPFELIDIYGNIHVFTAFQMGNYIVGYATTYAFGAIGMATTAIAGQADSLHYHDHLEETEKGGSIDMISMGVVDAIRDKRINRN